MKRLFIKKRFSESALMTISVVNKIIGEYAAQGLSLTLRQVYYQFVSRDLIANNDKEYKKLGDVVSDGRMAGLIDWSAIEDRTRYLRSLSSWGSPAEIVRAVSQQYRIDMWENQRTRVEVWVEKDALVGIIESACNPLRVPHFSCRGYSSQTALYDAGQRIAEHIDRGQRVVILHFGDHDPSGLDMTRDITERLRQFADLPPLDMNEDYCEHLEVRRLALNFDQIKQYKPPPNPAKITDSRAAGYISRFGTQSWELDALEPKTLIKLIKTEIGNEIDEDAWDEAQKREESEKDTLREIAEKLEKD